MLLGVDQLSQRDSRHFIGSTNWVGKRVPYHLTANGKVFLAWGAAADERVSAEELARVGERVRVTRVDELEVGLTAECAEARQGGTRPGDELGSYAVIGDLHEIVPAIVAALCGSEAAVARGWRRSAIRRNDPFRKGRRFVPAGDFEQLEGGPRTEAAEEDGEHRSGAGRRRHDYALEAEIVSGFPDRLAIRGVVPPQQRIREADGGA
jgi:hypothetical protein